MHHTGRAGKVEPVGGGGYRIRPGSIIHGEKRAARGKLLRAGGRVVQRIEAADGLAPSAMSWRPDGPGQAEESAMIDRDQSRVHRVLEKLGQVRSRRPVLLRLGEPWLPDERAPRRGRAEGIRGGSSHPVARGLSARSSRGRATAVRGRSTASIRSTSGPTSPTGCRTSAGRLPRPALSPGPRPGPDAGLGRPVRRRLPLSGDPLVGYAGMHMRHATDRHRSSCRPGRLRQRRG